jgi:hypothetical protein
MILPATFPRFPELAPELQVMIISYVLEEDWAQRETNWYCTFAQTKVTKLKTSVPPPHLIAPHSVR